MVPQHKLPHGKVTRLYILLGSSHNRARQATAALYIIGTRSVLEMGYIPNLFNFWVVAYVAIGATACSYGLAIIGSTLGQPSFYKSLGLEADPTAPGYSRTAALIGAFNGMLRKRHIHERL